MVKILELFGGIGAPRKALMNLNIDFESVDYVENWKGAVNAYNALYDTTYQPQDVSTWKPKSNTQIDILFHGSPCQDFSTAGLGRGGAENSGTRSSLLWQTIDIITNRLSHKPKVVIWENVKGVLNKKHRAVFEAYLEQMKQLGYHNQYQVLNSLDFGIPQRRERVFVVSILDNDYHFSFDNLIKTPYKPLKDFLEYGQIDSHYFVRQPTMIRGLKEGRLKVLDTVTGKVTNGTVTIPLTNNHTTNKFGVEIVPTINTHADTSCVGVTELDSKEFSNFITLPRASDGALINGSYNRFWKTDKYTPTVSVTNPPKILQPANDPNVPIFLINEKLYHLRILTERECYRLMGFSDTDFDKVKHLQHTHLYKTAGNSIVVSVLEAIFKELLKEKEKNETNWKCR